MRGMGRVDKVEVQGKGGDGATRQVCSCVMCGTCEASCLHPCCCPHPCPSAPQSILVAGKPHLGTERLVRLLKEFRSHLQVRGNGAVHNPADCGRCRMSDDDV